MSKTWIYFFCIIPIAFSFTAMAQVRPDSSVHIFRNDNDPKSPFYILTGNVKDEEGKPIQGVSILVDGSFTGRVSNENGIYYTQVDSGDHRITFRHIAFVPVIYKVSMYGHGLLNTTMREKTLELEEITIIAEGASRNVNNPISGISRITARELKTMPMLMGEADVIRSLELLPGVTSVGEGSAGLNIRGGQADQNLVMLNDALILNTNHALGFLSSFNPDMVENFTLYKGNIPSQYGGRSSSALNVVSKKGDFEYWTSELNLGTSANRIASNGPIVKDKISFLGTARLSNANWLLNRVNNPEINSSRLNFYDLYGNLSFKINNKNTIDLQSMYTSDLFQLSDQFGFEWSNSITSINTKSLVGKNLSFYSVWAYGSFTNSYYEPNPEIGQRLSNGMNYFQGKVSGLYTIGEHAVNFGVEAINYISQPEKLEPFVQRVFNPVSDQLIQKENGTEIAPYLSLEWNPIKRFSMVAGIRYSHFRQNNTDSVFRYLPDGPKTLNNISDTLLLQGSDLPKYQGWEPRISFRFNLTDDMSFKGGYSKTYQYIQSISNTTGPTPIDLWQLSNYHILPQVSDNFSIGYFMNLKENKWSLSLDFFLRKSINQIEYRDFANLLVNPHIETELILAEADARGVEFMIKKNQGKWTGWVAYTFSRTFSRSISDFPAEQINRGNWFPSNWDRPHVGTLIMSRKLWQGGSFNFNINYATGRPISGINSIYVINKRLVPQFSDRNEFRIPNYFRIDVSYTTGSLFIPLDDSFTFGIYNLLGRRNAYSVFYQTLPNSSRLVPFRLSLLGTLLPSVSYKVRF